MRSRLTFPVLLAMCTAGAAEPLSVGKWLVDLGRDYPLSRQASVSDVDAELTLLFMEAASRAEPNLAEAYLWQSDMLWALGRTADARRALGEYVAREPADARAHLDWIERSIAELQTAEARAEFCTQTLARKGLAREARSDLHRRLAEFYWNRGQLRQAEEAALAALEQYPFNLAARQLLDLARGVADGPRRRVTWLVDVLRVAPASAAAAQQLGDELVSVGLYAEAGRFYAHAAEMHRLIPPGTVPADLLYTQADVLLEQGELDQARERITAARREDPSGITGHRLAVRLARREANTQAVQDELSKLESTWKQLLTRSGGRLDAAIGAEMAWSFVHDLNHAEEARRLATAVLADGPNVVAQRALGAALRELKEYEAARSTLESVAGEDLWAAIELARTLHEKGEQSEASRRLAELATRPASTQQRRMLRSLGEDWGVTMPAEQPGIAEIRAALQTLPADVLKFPSRPEDYLEVSVRMQRAELPPSEPWLCTIELRNVGTFPIVLGEEAMLTPELLFSIQTSGTMTRTSGPTLRVRVNRGLSLQPGESIRCTQTLSIGPLRGSMIGTPQVAHEVEIAGLLNPIALFSREGEQVYAPAPGGQVITPVRFRRTALFASSDEVSRLLGGSRSQDLATRITSLESLCMLLAEHQYLTSGRLGYSVPRIDPEVVRNAIFARAADEDWRVRARLAECMRWFLLDTKATQSATRMLGDGHWLVRGLVLRALTDHHGEKFTNVLETFSRSDGDAWVRRMAGVLLARQQAARAAVATQPAGPQSTAQPAATRPAAEAPRPVIALPEAGGQAQPRR